MQKFLVILTLSAIFFSGHTLAQKKHQTKTAKSFSSKAAYLSLGQLLVDDATARMEGIDSSASYIQLGFEAQHNLLVYGIGLSGYFYKDSREFNQAVENQAGSRFSANSSAEATNLFGEIGYSFTRQKALHFDIIAGLEQVLQSSRGITDCSNCFSEDIQINSGLYAKPRLRLVPGKSFVIDFALQQYLSGDIVRAWMISIGYTDF